MADGEKPLRKFTRGFHAISQMVGPNYPPMNTKAFADACSEMQALFHVMGEYASFWLDEYAPKVCRSTKKLIVASMTYIICSNFSIN
jgi:hypothetical protein